MKKYSTIFLKTSELSAKTLSNIKYSSITISILYAIGMPLLFIMADKEDAPGVLLFGLILFSASIVSAVFAAIFEKRCHEN